MSECGRRVWEESVSVGGECEWEESVCEESVCVGARRESVCEKIMGVCEESVLGGERGMRRMLIM